MASLNRIAGYTILLGIGAYWLKSYISGQMCESRARLDDKVAIITGANTGIGRSNALDFIQRGAKVIMACRSMKKGLATAAEIKKTTQASDEQLVVMELDLASLKSIRVFVQQFKARETRLDILVNNAGLMWTPHSLTEDGFEMQFGVNHLGHFLLTHLLADMLIKSSPSRIINVSSKAQEYGTINFDNLMPDKDSYNGGLAYCQSKLANVLFTRELAKRLQGSGVYAYSVHPGSVRTELPRHFKLFHVPIIKDIIWFILTPFSLEPEQGAQTQICCAVDEKLADNSYSGKYFSDCKPTQLVGAASNKKDDKRLWDVSLELVKLEQGEIHPQLR